MRTLAALLLCAVPAGASDSPPELRFWVPAQSTNAVAPDVHAVHADDDFIYVESAGLSLHSFGALEANQYDIRTGPRQFTFKIPRHPKPASGIHTSTPLGIVGVFVTGVPIYNPVGTASWRDQNIWHRDAVASSAAGVSQLVAALTTDASRHSPIIGFALDGYPIYGPFGFDALGNVKRMASSYRLRAMKRRNVLPDGTVLTPPQEGPDTGPDYPLGTFAEDYEFVRGSGDLDEYNGRYARTPDYPEGTYAYFLSIWPYMIGPQYKGVPPFATRTDESRAPVVLRVENTLLTLAFHDRQGHAIRFLENVHQRPIHLVVVSKDLAEFAHLHPAPAPGDVFSVDHAFPHGGDYSLYADYTAPGAAPAVAKFDITVPGERRKPEILSPDTQMTKTVDGVTVTLNAPKKLKAGENLTFRFALSVQDLEPYLDAWAHIMFVSQDRETFIHAHALETAMPMEHVHTAPMAGPSPSTISAVTAFRTPGIYKLWFQFQRNGIVATVPWVIRVERFQ